MELYRCDPAKNVGCTKELCYINGGVCELTTKKEYKMENEIRFYLKAIKEVIESGDFEPTYIVTAVKLPTGAIELAVNDKSIPEKIDYILGAYDDDMRLKSNTDVVMQNIMVV